MDRILTAHQEWQAQMYMNNDIVVARWPDNEQVRLNWGDKLNGELIYLLSQRPVANVTNVHGWEDRPVFRVIGSGLARLRRHEIVWGMGFMTSTETLATVPTDVCAVRGPLSRDRLIEFGVECPEVYGDPAVLLPLFFSPDVEVDCDVGYIAHFRELGNVEPLSFAPGVKSRQINICGDVRQVVREILSCRLIVSSSLHGIICAHSYGVPAYWHKASDLPLGDGFKFRDYFASIGVPNAVSAVMDENGVFGTQDHADYPTESLIDPDKLIAACPFIGSSRKKQLSRTLSRAVNAGRRGTIFNA